MTTLAAVIIGDEVLSGKVVDENGPRIIEMCRRIGVRLDRMCTIGDEVVAIAEEVARCAATHDAVITSGGVGPTHDDRTMQGVARAFAVPVVRSPEIEELIRTYWGDRVTDAALRMAEMPEGARLVAGKDGLLPVVVWGATYILPGVPELFQAKLATIERELSGQPMKLRSLFLRSDESRIAPLLDRVDREHPAVKVGSYPRLDHPEHRLWITLESLDEEALEEALGHLLELLPAADVVRVE